MTGRDLIEQLHQIPAHLLDSALAVVDLDEHVSDQGDQDLACLDDIDVVGGRVILRTDRKRGPSWGWEV